MNETELRALLTDRAGRVVGDSDRYTRVRRRVTVRRRARLAGVAAATSLLVLGSALAVPALRGGRPADVAVNLTSSPTQWPRRGSDDLEGGFRDAFLEPWGGAAGGARLLYADKRRPFVVVSGRNDAGRPVVAVMSLREPQAPPGGDAFGMSVGEVPLRDRMLMVALLGQAEDGDRYVVVLAAPGVDEAVAIVGAERRSLGAPRDGLFHLEGLPDGPVRVELRDAGHVVTTEDVVAVMS